MTLLVLYAGSALAFSFLCSLLEASFLSARTTTLAERKEAGHEGAALLYELKQERVDDALSAILILNTVANTAGAALAGAQAGALFGDPWVGVFTFGLILSILIFSEIIPKTLGAVYADRVVGFTAYTIRFLTWVFAPLLLLTRLITSFLAQKENPLISRREISAMVTMATRQGTLQATDSRMVSNVLRYREIQVEDVMTPRTVIAMLPATTTIQGFLGEEDVRAFSRIPLFEKSRDDVVGYVLQREVLAAAAGGEPRGTPVRTFHRKPLYIPQGQSVGRALRLLTESREHIAFVTDEYGGISGLVSLEDLMETILGIEILDEFDQVADLRVEATKLRDRRLREATRGRPAEEG